MELIRYILDRGGSVRAYDPKATENAKRALTEAGFELETARIEFCSDSLTVAEGADAIMLATEWPEFARIPWGEVLAAMRQPSSSTVATSWTPRQ